MSSHHFVKEGQEPALIISCPVTSQPYLDLLEWAPVTMVLEPAIESVLTLGFKVDIVITRHQNRELFNKFAHQFPVKFLSSESDSLLSTALEFAIANKQSAINVIWDEPLKDFLNDEKYNHLSINIFTQTQKHTRIIKSFHKWMKSGQTLHLNTSNVTISNNARLENDLITMLTDGVLEIKSDYPFWLIENYQDPE